MTAAKIPEWMSAKIATLAREKSARDGCSPAEAVNVMTGDAFATLGAELSAFPHLAGLLPLSLSRNIKSGAFSALTALELAAIVIADFDAQKAAPCAGLDDISAFTNLKFEALAELLKAEDEGVRNV